jgi:pimeloyl-ACP methyl ester carboxylesterase
VVLPHDQRGDGEPFVLLHAGIADRRMFAEHLGPLAAAGLRAIALDLPGFGEAPVASGPDGPWLDVLETVDAIGVERFAVAGNSFGGAVALRVAALAPERVAALALFSAPGPETGSDPSARLRAAWAAEEQALEAGDIDAAVAAVVDTWTLPDAPRELRERVAAMQRRAFLVQGGVPEPPDAPDPVEADPEVLARFAGPVLVAVGEFDMPDFHDAASEIASLCRGARPAVRRETMPGVGHLAPLEAPEAFRDLLVGCLR